MSTTSLRRRLLFAVPENATDADSELFSSLFLGEHPSLPSSSSSSSSPPAPTMAPSAHDTTTNDNVVALTLPRISALLSFLAVICVAIEAYKDFQADQETRRRNSTSTLTNVTGIRSNRKVPTVTHIQLFFQIPLFCQAVALGLGTTPVPAHLNVWGAVGNQTSCDLQGLLVQFSMIGSVGWDMALSLAYLLMVRYNVHSTRLQTNHKYYHLFIWPVALAMSIYPLTQGMYNYNTTVCWLETYPNECQGDECLRGQGAPLWQNITSGIAMIHFCYSMVVIAVLYCTVRRLTSRQQHQQQQQQPKLDRHQQHEQRRQNRYTKAIAVQGMLYASAIFVSVLPSVILILLWNVFGVWSDGFSIFATTTTPLMGYANFVIFMRGRQVEDCHTGYAKFLRRIHSWMFDRSWCGFWSWLCCCTCSCNIQWTGPRLFGQPQKHAQRPLEESMTASTTHRFHQSDFPSRQFEVPPPASGASSSKGQQSNGSPNSYFMDEVGQDSKDNNKMPPLEEEKGNTRNNWLGFLISWTLGKHGDTANTSQYISELTFGPSTGPQEHDNIDFSPAKPKRTRSPKRGSSNAPVLPQRAISEMSSSSDDDSSDSDSDDDSTVEDKNDKYKNERVPKLPSSQPIRLKSYMPDITLKSALQGFTPTKLAPIKPVRLESYVSEATLEEIEDWHYASKSTHSVLSPPALPQRFVSEIEELSSDNGSRSSFANDDDSNRQGKAETAALGSSLSSGMKAAMRLVQRAILQDDEVVGGSSRRCIDDGLAPAVQPQRFVSEVETLSVGSDQHDEEDDLDDNVELGEAERRPSEAPPTRPIRYASEVESELSDLEEDDTHIEDTCQAGEVKASEMECESAPVRPVRYASEVEELDMESECSPESDTFACEHNADPDEHTLDPATKCNDDETHTCTTDEC